MTLGAFRRLQEAHAAFERQPSLDQACLLTIPVLLLYAPRDWIIGIPVVVLSVSALLFPRFRSSPTLWFTVACFLLAAATAGWSQLDNHKYLIAYWTLAIALVIGARGGEEHLALAARLLVGLTFTFAMLWKLLSPDFLSTDFFHYSLLFDDRFSTKLAAAGILEGTSAELNGLAREALVRPESTLQGIEVATNPTVRRLALALTVWTLALEGFIACVFLVPGWSSLRRARDPALLLFIVSAYAVAPVLGFATVLATMGFVQCERHRVGTRFAYLLAFVAMQIFRVPWAALLNAGPPP